MDPPTKHQKDVKFELVFHIYRKQNSHLITDIGKLIAGSLLFSMRSCKYSTTPKGGIK